MAISGDTAARPASATPAPDLSALVIKIEAVSPDGDKDQIPVAEFRAIEADVRRLAAAQ